MSDRGALTRIIALAGTIEAWFPVALMLLTSAVESGRSRVFRMDYLIPAELFPAIIAGGALLVLGARRAHRRPRLIWGSFFVAIIALLLSQSLAIASGLASGQTPPAGLPWVVTVLFLAVYDAAVVTLAVAGVLSVCDVFRPIRHVSEEAPSTSRR